MPLPGNLDKVSSWWGSGRGSLSTAFQGGKGGEGCTCMVCRSMTLMWLLMTLDSLAQSADRRLVSSPLSLVSKKPSSCHVHVGGVGFVRHAWSTFLFNLLFGHRSLRLNQSWPGLILCYASRMC